MKFASRISMALIALTLSSPAFASFGHGDSDKSPSPPKSSDPTADAIKEANGGNRSEAEKWYRKAKELGSSRADARIAELTK